MVVSVATEAKDAKARARCCGNPDRLADRSKRAERQIWLG